MFVQHGMGMTFTLLKISSSNFISFLKSTLFLFVLFIHSLSLFKIFFLNVSEKIKCVYIILLICFLSIWLALFQSNHTFRCQHCPDVFSLPTFGISHTVWTARKLRSTPIAEHFTVLVFPKTQQFPLLERLFASVICRQRAFAKTL